MLRFAAVSRAALHTAALVAVTGALAVAPGCDDGNDDASTSEAAASTGVSGMTTGETGTPPSGTTTANPTTADPTTATTTTANPTTDDPTDATTTGDPTDATTGAGDSSTGEAPTTGPGVLPGETGQDAMCRRAMECGSTYFADAQECIDAGTNYWGECAEAVAALDAFGACMSDMACEDYNPDAYNPSNTPCADLYGELQQAGPC